MVNILRPEIVSANINKKEELYLSGTFMHTGVMANGHIYPRDVIKDAVSIFDKLVKNSPGRFGCVGYPSTGIEINIENVSHMITEVSMDGDNVIGKLKILDTSSGREVKRMIKSGIKFSATSNMHGRLDDNKMLTDTTIITWNILVVT